MKRQMSFLTSSSWQERKDKKLKIAIVTDSSAYLTDAECQQYHIQVVPTPIIMDNQIFHEGVDLDNTDFYQYLRTSESLPNTSQPALGDMIKCYENLANAGYDTVLSIHMGSGISGLYQTLCAAASTIDFIKVVPYDSKITVRLLGYLVIQAARLAQAGADLETIIAQLDQLRAQINEVFIVNDLYNLVRGGRLSNVSASIGSALKIKPLLTFDKKTAKIITFAKVRSLRRAFLQAEQVFAEDLAQSNVPLRLLVIHANDEATARQWQTKLQAQFPDVVTELTYFGPSIGTHLGEKALALGWMPDIDQLPSAKS